MKKIVIGSVAMMAMSTSFGAGFGIYEASARGLAMGDAVVGDVSDATANYHNPANIANATNIQIAAGVTFINPFYDVEINKVRQAKMNSGWFTIPHFYLTVPLCDRLALGWGNYTEYGAGTKYNSNWAAADDSYQTTIEQMTFNPNLAYKVTDWLNVAVGGRLSWFSFEKKQHISSAANPYTGTSHPYSALDPVWGADMTSRLDADDWGAGWNAAISVKPIEDVTVGLVYRSQIKHKVKGYHTIKGQVYPLYSGEIVGENAHYEHNRATGKVTLPDSVVLGINWDVTERYRVGLACTYTRWSTIKSINVVSAKGKPLDLHWRDSLRTGIGMEYDFTDWFCGRIGYMYDNDPSRGSYMGTIIPPGDRHVITFGGGFKIMEDLYLDLAGGFIRMNNEHGYLHSDTANKGDYVSFRNGSSFLASATIRYEF